MSEEKRQEKKDPLAPGTYIYIGRPGHPSYGAKARVTGVVCNGLYPVREDNGNTHLLLKDELESADQRVARETALAHRTPRVCNVSKETKKSKENKHV